MKNNLLQRRRLLELLFLLISTFFIIAENNAETVESMEVAVAVAIVENEEAAEGMEVAEVVEVAETKKTNKIDSFSFGFQTKADITFTKDERFQMKTQGGGSIGLTLEFPIYRSLTLGASLSLHKTWPSSLEGGYLYRGFWGMDVRMFFSVRPFILYDGQKLLLRLGSSQGGFARYDRYDLTTLNFFYPGIFIQPLLDFHFKYLYWACFEVSIPFDIYFRRDLEISLSTGLTLVFKIYPIKLINESKKRKHKEM